MRTLITYYTDGNRDDILVVTDEGLDKQAASKYLDDNGIEHDEVISIDQYN